MSNELLAELSELLGLSEDQPLRLNYDIPILTQLARYGIRPNLPVRILRVALEDHLPLLAATIGAAELGDKLPASIINELRYNQTTTAQCPGALVGTLCVDTTVRNARIVAKRLWVLLSASGNTAHGVMGVTTMTVINDAAGRISNGDCSIAVREARRYQCWIAAIPAVRLFC